MSLFDALCRVAELEQQATDRLGEVRALRRRIGNQRRELRLISKQLARVRDVLHARLADDEILEAALDRAGDELAPLFDGDRELSMQERAARLVDRCNYCPIHGGDR